MGHDTTVGTIAGLRRYLNADFSSGFVYTDDLLSWCGCPSVVRVANISELIGKISFKCQLLLAHTFFFFF